MNKKNYPTLFINPKIIALLILFVNINAFAQQFPSWYLVNFTDKNNTTFSIDKPLEFLSQKAIDRRVKNNIAIDISDIPVNKNYIDSLSKAKVKSYYQSKWMNAVLVKIDSSPQLQIINNISIVSNTTCLGPFVKAKKNKKSSKSVKFKNASSEIQLATTEYSETFSRIDMINLKPLLDLGKNGSGVDIAVFDNGFNKVDKIDAFEHLFKANRIKELRNFTNNGKKLFRSGGHGTMVLSTMAAIVNERFMGSAIAANYFLFQTEDNRYEYPIEEANWLFAAEYADSIGIDIITSSLVYSIFDDSQYDHYHAQLDGKTAIISRAATMAANKGILVFNSAGNEGDDPWTKICFPSDAEGIITVGAVDGDGVIADFSSKGYSADHRIKPDIVAEGHKTPLIGTTNKIFNGSGTSFSTPFIAGAAATLISIFPEASKNDIHNAIIESSHIYQKPDSLMGYGIPDFYLASILLNIDSVNAVISAESFVIIPNPFENDLHVLFNASDSQMVEIMVYDISGNVVYENHGIHCHKGNNLFNIKKANQLAKGIYIISLKTKEETFSKKVVKK